MEKMNNLFTRLQGCQMVYFHAKNPHLGTYIFEEHWNGKCWSFGIFYGYLEYFMVIWNIWYVLRPFGKCVVIWCMFPPFWYFAPIKIGNSATFWYFAPIKIWQLCLILVLCTNKNLAALLDFLDFL
jgi:hypothetical protein